MSLNINILGDDDTTSFSVDTNVYRQLITQQHESSIQLYGVDSEQTRMLKLHLTAHAAAE